MPRRLLRCLLLTVCLAALGLAQGCATEPQTAKLLADLPDYAPTPDGTAIDADGALVVACPNYGSYAIPPVLKGTDQLMELLERLDLRHNMPELLGITNSFLGSYMLLPSPSKLPSELSGLYQRDTWGDVPGLSQEHLNRTYRFYKDLEDAPTVDPGRMVYIAGCRVVTIDSMRIVSPGEFEYKLGYLGDGRVPHELGLLPGVPTYYIHEVHGDLARNERVLRAGHHGETETRCKEDGEGASHGWTPDVPSARILRLDRGEAGGHSHGGLEYNRTWLIVPEAGRPCAGCFSRRCVRRSG